MRYSDIIRFIDFQNMHLSGAKMVPACSCSNQFGFVLLILRRKIIKIVATRCHILRLKCTKINFGWGLAAESAGVAPSAFPDTLAGFKGSYF